MKQKIKNVIKWFFPTFKMARQRFDRLDEAVIRLERILIRRLERLEDRHTVSESNHSTIEEKVGKVNKRKAVLLGKVKSSMDAFPVIAEEYEIAALLADEHSKFGMVSGVPVLPPSELPNVGTPKSLMVFITSPTDAAAAKQQKLLRSLGKYDYFVVTPTGKFQYRVEGKPCYQPCIRPSDCYRMSGTKVDAACHCGAPKSKISCIAKGKANRLCKCCASTERTRILSAILQKNDICKDNREWLHIAHTIAETLVINRYNPAKLTTLDVRTERESDIVADIANMPEVKDSSYDYVFISHVLECVKDDDKALSEIARVLRPGGVLILSAGLRGHEHTIEVSSDKHEHYGKDYLQRYNVGLFRRYGTVDLMEKLQVHFNVLVKKGIDAPTGLTETWHICTKRNG